MNDKFYVKAVRKAIAEVFDEPVTVWVDAEHTHARYSGTVTVTVDGKAWTKMDHRPEPRRLGLKLGRELRALVEEKRSPDAG